MSETTRSIVLGDREEAFIESQLRAGSYRDASDLVRTALHRLEAEEAELRELIMVGMRDVEAGRYTEYTSAEELKRDILRRAKSAR